MHRLQSRALGDLLCLCKSRESGLYCGASSGLILLTPEGDIRQFNRRNGIVNDMIHGVLGGCARLHLVEHEQGPRAVQPRP